MLNSYQIIIFFYATVFLPPTAADWHIAGAASQRGPPCTGTAITTGDTITLFDGQ
jgi:hypothetical protein